jgi:hypothetical protein
MRVPFVYYERSFLSHQHTTRTPRQSWQEVRCLWVLYRVATCATDSQTIPSFMRSLATATDSLSFIAPNHIL